MNRVVAGAFFSGALVFLYFYPVWQIPLCVFSFLYVCLLVYKPELWLFFVPAIISSVYLSRISGWFFWDISDLTAMLTIAVLYFRLPVSVFLPQQKLSRIVISLLCLSYGISFLIGFFPIEKFDFNSFAGYHNHFNSLRVVKGFLWALLLQPFIRTGDPEKTGEDLRLLTAGFSAGLAGVVFWGILERINFTGILNFDQAFRINSVFSSMHIGGGVIEAYLSMAIPLVLTWAWASGGKWRFFAAIPLVAGGSYVMVMTYSRIGYIALLGAFVILMVLTLGKYRKMDAKKTAGTVMVMAVFAMLMVGLLAQSRFLQERFSGFMDGYRSRMQLWKTTFDLMDKDMVTRVFGMGLGAFPKAYRDRQPEEARSGLHCYETENGNHYLRLVGGRFFYFDQTIDRSAEWPLGLSLDIRGQVSSPTPRWLSVLICEKNMLYSVGCPGNTAINGNPTGRWERVQLMIDRKGETAPGFILQNPLTFSLSLSEAGRMMDIDNIRLTDARGRELIRNGDFSAGYDHWFFTSDDHLMWHIENIFVAAYFEQGAAGVISLAGFLLLLPAAGFHLYRTRGLAWAGFIAAMGGFIITATCVSVFDFPRMTFLFFLTGFFLLRSDPGVPGNSLL